MNTPRGRVADYFFFVSQVICDELRCIALFVRSNSSNICRRCWPWSQTSSAAWRNVQKIRINVNEPTWSKRMPYPLALCFDSAFYSRDVGKCAFRSKIKLAGSSSFFNIFISMQKSSRATHRNLWKSCGSYPILSRPLSRMFLLKNPPIPEMRLF